MLGLIIFAVLAEAEPHGDHHRGHGPGPAPSVLRVTINPEARVSAERGTEPAPEPPCGAPTPISIEIDNQSGGRAPLVATALTPDFEVVAQPAPLTGRRSERRTVALRLLGAPPVDVALGFDVGPGTSDLAWRSETHLLLSCRAQARP